MRSTRNLLAILVVAVLAVPPALASMGGGGKSEEMPPPTSVPSEQQQQLTSSRQDAERYYGDAYGDVAKAKKALAENKKKDADKKFKKALERGERAVELDSTYYEAWNLVGYCARNLTLYDQSLSAYQRCLAIKPDYAPAREYLGEALLEMGKIDQAREQLGMLQKMSAPEALELKIKLDAWAVAHPDSSATSTTTASTTPAPADTSSTAPAQGTTKP
jgi:tetratricopeptide (TPR) repeat protein